MKTVFLGTPAPALPSLEALDRVSDVVGVITQPDRPRGRRGSPQAPPVKERATQLGIPVHQPGSSRAIAEILGGLGTLDLAVVVAFGMLIRPEALERPRLGFVNVHFSILPRWRGAAPVQRAILAGDTRTGVTIMQLDEGLDTGPILSVASTAIGRNETGGDLTGRLSLMGAALLASQVGARIAGVSVATRQPGEGATAAPKLAKSERRLDLHEPAELVRRRIMALAPQPGAHALWRAQQFKILRAGAVTAGGHSPPGALEIRDGALYCGAGDGTGVELTLVQPAGKRPMAASDWARGVGEDLGLLE